MESEAPTAPRADKTFERMYKRHVHDVYRYAFAVLRNAADAEDVTQTAFLNAYRAYERGERPQKPKNWLIAITHNVCRQRFRTSQARPQEVEFDEGLAEAHVPDEEFTAEDIRRALDHLAFNQRAALIARELEGRSYAEIAEIMGLTIGAVETLIFRARRALREQLEGSLTCDEAEFALSKQTDGRLSRSEKGQLRAHLRECKHCEGLARRSRAQRVALQAFGAVPLPWSLASLFGGGGTAVGVGLVAKTAAVVAAGTLVAGGTYETVAKQHRRAPAPASPAQEASGARPAVPRAVPRAPSIREVSVKPVHAPPAAKKQPRARAPVHVFNEKPAKRQHFSRATVNRVKPVKAPKIHRQHPTGGPAK